MHFTLETTYINFYSMISTRYFSYVGYICYVEECKFSTSTHENYHIVQNIVSAICGYFYSSQNPSGGSEMTLTVKKVLKISKPMQRSNQLNFLARYRARRLPVSGQWRFMDLPNLSTFFTVSVISEPLDGFWEL